MVGFCDGQKWRWGRFSLRTSVSLANLHSIRFSTIIFTITRSWQNRPGVAAVPIASQTRIKKKNTVKGQNRVQSWVTSRGICGIRSGIQAGFSLLSSVPPPNNYSTIVPYWSMTTPWGVQQSSSGSTLSDPRFFSVWGFHFWAGFCKNVLHT
jgi:hypothetical protein